MGETSRAFFKDFSLGDQMILAIHLSAPAPIISIWLPRSHIVPEQISYCAWTNFRDFENTSKSSLYFWKVDSHGAIILRQIKIKYFGNNFNNLIFKMWVWHFWLWKYKRLTYTFIQIHHHDCDSKMYKADNIAENFHCNDETQHHIYMYRSWEISNQNQIPRPFICYMQHFIPAPLLKG